ncbi:uncharacterized protein [Rutidosis leptorrhynchoides]|uniref:uncharacterized protein isoform X2 n=1 Tax=Rutidosis leptorrhynchoides TaxID=125765 RepID=UPI003A98D5AA
MTLQLPMLEYRSHRDVYLNASPLLDGVAQSELAKELGIKSNYIYYSLKGLESRGLIVRQSTIIRKKEAGNDEYKNGSIVNTNMLHLYRYAKHLGHLQRIEITKEDNTVTGNDDAERGVATVDGVTEERIKDFVPAIRAICDRLEKADGKVLVISDIKKELGYTKTSGHRAWRNILHRMKDAHLVEDFVATVNNKEVNCLRLLKTFSPKTHGAEDDDLDPEQQVKMVKRGQITEQLMELPIEQQIYDMIDAEGSEGLILNEVYKRLGINNKRYYPRILDMVSRFGMHLDSESLNRGMVYRVWTSGNYDARGSKTTPGKEDIGKSSTHGQPGKQTPPHIIIPEDIDDWTSKVDAESSEEQNIDDTQLDSTSLNNQQCETSDIIVVAEPQIVNAKPVSTFDPLELSSPASPAPRRRRSYKTYPCLGLSTTNSQREQRILEKLQEEKVLIRPELQRLLDSLENFETKHMDRKTLERCLNKLQEDGHCKCISFAVPPVTNCGGKRTIDVILHPSVYEAKDLSDRVHDKWRSFEKEMRRQSTSRYKSSKCKSIPVLNDVERIYTSTSKLIQAETAERMKNNGFVLAKMVRAKLLHVFLWGYVTRLPGWDAGTVGFDQRNPHSSCKLLELDAAIKAMPLELFLQVAGSSVKLESMVEKCRNGLCLSDLPINEYRSLMGTRATGLISCLIDILRRLKLIRLIAGETDVPVGPHATLRHSLELKPYIEEPVGIVFPSTSVNSFDIRPNVRHDFFLASRKDVHEYWNTLEYCYAASDPKAALHAFPGSVVHEIFLSRSWASVRVMTAHQRAELFKHVASEGSDKKISYRKCEKIAENLNLTLEQVLRVFYDKRQKDKMRVATSANKRKRSSEEKSVNNENFLALESGKLKRAKLFSVEDSTTEQNSLLEINNMLINEMDGQKVAVDDDDDMELIEDENSPSSILHECASSSRQSSNPKKFSWTANKDRQLVIEYVKHRATLGAKFHRIDWALLKSLPGPPNACKRRMSNLNRNKQFRNTVMKICNLLSVRYAKHLQHSQNNSLDDNSRMIIEDHNASALVDYTNVNTEERWDDFENEDIKMLLDEALKCKQTGLANATKGAQYISKYPQSDVVGELHDLDENNMDSSTSPVTELKKDGASRQASVRRSRRPLPKSYAMLMNKVKDYGTNAYKSLAVSNAMELFKLVFLSTAKAPEVPNLLAETLRRYSEHDLLTAFNYLRDRNFMVRGNAISHFVLSQQFIHNISSSPFPVNTGKRAIKMNRWLHEREDDLLDSGVDLSADLQCGDVLQLSVLMCWGEISVFPCLPDEGVGEVVDSKKRTFDDDDDNEDGISVEVAAKKQKSSDSEIFSRKEKGFPGIQLSLSRSVVSKVDSFTLSGVDENARTSSSISLEQNSAAHSVHLANTDSSSESIWEAMTCYARHLESSSSREPSLLCPNLFKTIYSAVQKAGDQGLSMEGISDVIDVQGEDIPELIVEVLEAFGRALKVNAYDCVHVVDPLYRSKYFLTSMGSHQHDSNAKVPESCNNDGEPLELLQECHKDKDKNLAEETCTDLELYKSNDEVHHRVTILNHPEETSLPVREVESNNEIETYTIEKIMPGPQETTTCESHVGDTLSCKPILPWVNGDGTVNDIVYKGLVRRVLGIVMQNPGILEVRVCFYFFKI